MYKLYPKLFDDRCTHSPVTNFQVKTLCFAYLSNTQKYVVKGMKGVAVYLTELYESTAMQPPFS